MLQKRIHMERLSLAVNWNPIMPPSAALTTLATTGSRKIEGIVSKLFRNWKKLAK